MNSTEFRKVSYNAIKRQYNYSTNEYDLETIQLNCFTKDGILGVNVGTFEVVHIPSGFIIMGYFTKQSQAKDFICNLEYYLGNYYKQFLDFTTELSKELHNKGKSKLPKGFKPLLRRITNTVYYGRFSETALEDFIYLCEEK